MFLISFLIANEFYMYFPSPFEEITGKIVKFFFEPFAKHKETHMMELNHVIRDCYCERHNYFSYIGLLCH